MKNATRLTKSEVKTLRLRISVLSEELSSCTTTAMRKSVQESLDAARTALAAGL